MSTPDAAPVEVEGGRAALLAVLAAHNIECTGPGEVSCRGCRERDWMSWHDYRGHLADLILAALPAAPTTPDIADERVTELRAWLIGRMVAADERVQRAATLLDERRCDEARGQSEAFMQSINALDRALATPSTPGAGQADEGDARKWRCLGPGGSLGNKCTPDNPHASWRFNGCGWTTEPATGQGELS